MTHNGIALYSGIGRIAVGNYYGRTALVSMQQNGVGGEQWNARLHSAQCVESMQTRGLLSGNSKTHVLCVCERLPFTHVLHVECTLSIPHNCKDCFFGASHIR